MRLSIAVLALAGACPACAATRAPADADPGAMQAALAVGRLHPPSRPPAPRDSAPARPSGSGAPPCAPAPDAAAWLDCRGTHIATRTAIVAHPLERLPAPSTRAVLDAVAALMHARPGVQLLRIECFSSRPDGGEPARIRRGIARSQARADAVFRYLWQTRHVSPERMEAVGRGWVRGHVRKDVAFPVELRIIQRRP